MVNSLLDAEKESISILKQEAAKINNILGNVVEEESNDDTEELDEANNSVRAFMLNYPTIAEIEDAELLLKLAAEDSGEYKAGDEIWIISGTERAVTHVMRVNDYIVSSREVDLEVLLELNPPLSRDDLVSIGLFGTGVLMEWFAGKCSVLTSQQRNLLWAEATKLPERQIPVDVPRNKIIYGAPGTGKSYRLELDRREYFPKEEQFIRVTFHANYSYTQFVGTYKPVPIYKEGDAAVAYYGSDMQKLDQSKEPLIDYQFCPGPLLILLERALKHKKTNFLLLIEEINRANAAAVFGDVFQLLDRKGNGESEYGITLSYDAMNYLKSRGINKDKLRLPRNLFIWATMNSADQGVTPLDTAFKRRWSFEYISLSYGESIMDGYLLPLKFLKRPIAWNDFRHIINDKLCSEAIRIPEDKLIGPFFLKQQELIKVDDDEANGLANAAFQNKLLLYLKDDVLRHNSRAIFKEELKTFAQIVDAYGAGKEIFNFKFPAEYY